MIRKRLVSREIRNESNRYQRRSNTSDNSSDSIGNNKNLNPMYHLLKKETNIYFDEIHRLNSKGIDDKLPFFVSHPPIQGFFDLDTFANSKVQEVYNCFDGLKLDKIKNKYDIVTIIPFRNRSWHLEKTMSSLLESSKKLRKKIGFVIIEDSQNMLFDASKYSKNKNVHYYWIDSKGIIFNKCFCHNIGAGLSDSTYLHFHDCDLIVPDNFYKVLYSELEKNPAVQCFSGRRVLYMDEPSTKYYYQTESLAHLETSPDSIRPGVPGAPGGSIALSRNIFDSVGGFDPHFFWAYSIEDRFFWEKVETLNRFTTLDDPKIDLYHLWHPPGWGKNPYERFEQRIYQIFSSDGNKARSYIEASKKLYTDLIKRYINE